MRYCLILLLILIFFPIATFAAESNNKFGIHLAQPHLEELLKIKEMVNSNGGDWGYVTLVMQENDRDKNKWQEIFDKLRENHLIPIIRLATKPEGENWRRPEKQDADGWVNFLNSLNWVVKNRYVILFNEPNHGSEWGGEADPKNYGEVALVFAEKLKAKDKDFFIMLAGLDASAPSNFPYTEDEEIFLKSTINNQPSIIKFIDGISSHSYPNPGFSGSPYDTGRKSIRGYLWEIDLFRQLTGKNLPVFITETGWVRVQNFEQDKIAQNFQTAFSEVWGPDDRVKAVTPFVFDYQGQPFLDFSWKKYQSQDFYPQYYLIKSLAKIKGSPEQIEKGELKFDFPKQLVVESNFHFSIEIKNNGQSILDKDQGYVLKLENYPEEKYLFSDLKEVKPFEEVTIDLYLKTNGNQGKKQTRVAVYKNGNKIAQGEDWNFEILPLPQLNFTVGLYPKLKVKDDDFEIQVFSDKEELVYKRKGVKINDGKGKIDAVQNIALGKKYRVVILKQYYLPRQEIIVLNRGENKVNFKPMYPFDFNKDGKFSWEDLPALMKNPRLFSLLFP